MARATTTGNAEEYIRRAWFVVRALRRTISARNPKRQFAAERRNFERHKRASEYRKRVNTLIDSARDVYGPKLGWYLGTVENHCAVCKNAAGKNFSAGSKPSIGWPGAVHPNCDCSPGAPHKNGTTLS